MMLLAVVSAIGFLEIFYLFFWMARCTSGIDSSFAANHWLNYSPALNKARLTGESKLIRHLSVLVVYSRWHDALSFFVCRRFAFSRRELRCFFPKPIVLHFA